MKRDDWEKFRVYSQKLISELLYVEGTVLVSTAPSTYKSSDISFCEENVLYDPLSKFFPFVTFQYNMPA